MAGWSKSVVDDDWSSLEKSFKALARTGNLLDLEPGSEVSVNIELQQEDNCEKITERLFIEFLSLFYKQVYGTFCIRPLPPMLGDGQSVDLLKLFLVVREKGGYEQVSANGLWGLVGKECGFDSHVVADLKLVYVKYLDLLDRWLKNIVKDKDSGSGVIGKMTNFGEVPMDMESFKGILGKILDKKIKDGKCLNVESKNEMEFPKDGELCVGNEHCGVFDLNDGIKNVDHERIVGNGNKGGHKNVEVNGSSDMNDGRRLENVSEQRSSENCKNDDLISQQIVMEENEGSRKRKRDCYSSMIKWVIEVSKDPCDLAIGSLPERYMWKSYGNEHLWKQVLMVRESLLLRRNADSSTQSFWQNKPMHPAMYEDPSSSDGLRYSQRLLSAKESVNKSCRRIFPDSSSSAASEDLSDKVSDSTADSMSDLWVSSYRQKRVPLGSNFQVAVPEWNGQIPESDLKWLGTRIWPLREQNKRLIERERIGKGRQDSCGCPSLGSVECVRFHVAEKRTKLKLELGTAFYMFKFNSMGEEVAFSWVKEEEKKFQDIVESNPLSQGKCFWNELLKGFSSKGRESLVRYYFNVFLLRRRGTQNRTNTSIIDSDDDEAELLSDAVKTPSGSIFCSPKKVHLNSR